MSKYKKAGFLIALLVIPVFIFLFLKGFTTNHFDLPYFRPVLESGKVVTNSKGDTLFKPVSGWKFTEESEIVTEQIFKGKYVVVGRVLDSCDAASRKVLTNLGRIRTLGTTVPNLMLITLTDVSPDVKSVLNESESLDSRWKIWESNVGTIREAAQDLDLGMNEDQQTIPQNNRLVLLDKAGYVRGYYNGLQPAEIDRLMAEIKILDYSDSLKK